MYHEHEKLRLLIISGDPNANKQLYDVAVASRRFSEIHRMADGRFALEQLTTPGLDAGMFAPDTVIVDSRLAGLSGAQLTRELRRAPQTQDVFIAFLPAVADPRDQDEAETSGCDFYLRRPSSAHDLAAVLHMIANRSEAALHAREEFTRETESAASISSLPHDVLEAERNRNA
jgi:CheY-like chemotaxis protein